MGLSAAVSRGYVEIGGSKGGQTAKCSNSLYYSKRNSAALGVRCLRSIFSLLLTFAHEWKWEPSSFCGFVDIGFPVIPGSPFVHLPRLLRLPQPLTGTAIPLRRSCCACQCLINTSSAEYSPLLYLTMSSSGELATVIEMRLSKCLDSHDSLLLSQTTTPRCSRHSV